MPSVVSIRALRFVMQTAARDRSDGSQNVRRLCEQVGVQTVRLGARI